MSRFFSALLGASLAITAVQADTVTRAAPPALFLSPDRMPALPQLTPPPLSSLTSFKTTNDNPLPATLDAQADINAFGFACGPSLAVTPQDGALLDISISAPCKPNEVVTINHAGLSFVVSLSMTGAAQVVLPAMSDTAGIETVFQDQTRLKNGVHVPDLNEFIRLAVAWDADPPTVDASAPRHLPVTTYDLGDASKASVQILSHHIDPEARAGVVRMLLNTSVTSQNCDQPNRAKVVDHRPGQPEQRYELELLEPGCSRIGENLVLKNILPDLKLAAD